MPEPHNHSSGSAAMVATGPWIPNGPRPATQQGGARAPHIAARPTSSGRGGRAVEHTHMFREPDAGKPAAGDDGGRRDGGTYWIYVAYDYKMQTPFDQAKVAVCRLIDRMMDRLARQQQGGGTAAADAQVLPPPAAVPLQSQQPHHGKLSPPPTLAAPDGSMIRPKVRANLIVDLISTKKHINTAAYETGLPYQLGQFVYRYVDEHYGPWLVTSFVGISDNTARRVGRDVYYSKADSNLSKNVVPFSAIDNEHMFIVFPPHDVAGGSTASAGPGAASAGSGGLSSGRAQGGGTARSPSPGKPRHAPNPAVASRPLAIPRPGR